MKRPVILSLVERGWRAARTASGQLPAEITVVHVVKGRVPRSVRALIALTHPVCLVSSPRWLFWSVVWLAVLGWKATGRLRAVWVDNPRSYQRLIRFGCWLRVEVVLVQWEPHAPGLRV